MAKKRVLVSYGVDVDAVAGCTQLRTTIVACSNMCTQGSGHMGARIHLMTSAEVLPLLTPPLHHSNQLSAGYFAGTVGVQRILKLLAKYDIKATWFIPGHSLETFPEDMAAVRDAGHEIGLHGYSHENPSRLSVDQQRDILDKTYRMLTEFNGKPPRGSVAPWWETSKEGAQLLLDYGIEYDHSMSHHDCQPYYLRTGDAWSKIDYSKKPSDWMRPCVKGEETGLVEIPANCEPRPLYLLCCLVL